MATRKVVSWVMRQTLDAEIAINAPDPRCCSRDLFGYIEGFYNSRRLHSALSYRSPGEVERLAA